MVQIRADRRARRDGAEPESAVGLAAAGLVRLRAS
jgi:hypothetical protein